MNSTIRNDIRSIQTDTAKQLEAERRKSVEDLKNLGLISFMKQSDLTPLDTLFDETSKPTKDDAKVRPIL